MNPVLYEQCIPPNHVIQVVQGDITRERVDAIVNAANSHLQHGGGVAGTIARRGGPAIQRESNLWVVEHGPVTHAEPAFTSAGELACRYIIHAVGPIWGDGDEDTKLAAAVTGSLSVATRLGLESLALPAISTGIYGFPHERAAGIIFNALETYFVRVPASSLALVRLNLFDAPTIAAFECVWREQGR